MFFFDSEENTYVPNDYQDREDREQSSSVIGEGCSVSEISSSVSIFKKRSPPSDSSGKAGTVDLDSYSIVFGVSSQAGGEEGSSANPNNVIFFFTTKIIKCSKVQLPNKKRIKNVSCVF